MLLFVLKMSEQITYPQYRKYSHGKTFFKVLSKDEFEEIQLIGSKIILHKFKAKILPDRNYISDLTFNYKENWVEISSTEYESLKKKAVLK